MVLIGAAPLALPFLPTPASAQISQPSAGTAPAATPKDEIKSVAIALRGNRANLMKLKPTAAQVAQIAATPEDAAKLNAYVEKLFASTRRMALSQGRPIEPRFS